MRFLMHTNSCVLKTLTLDADLNAHSNLLMTPNPDSPPSWKPSNPITHLPAKVVWM